jgi:hypothetical protein
MMHGREKSDPSIVVRHRLCRPTANETLISHCRALGIELRRIICFFVAMKPANKAARSATEPSVKEPAAAESVERRVGTKGNADWQSTRRTQNRVSVSQALERIRQMGSRLLCRSYPRWEPYAGKPPVRLCAGGARQLASLPRQLAPFAHPVAAIAHSRSWHWADERGCPR